MLESIGSPALWAGFIGFVLLMLALDLGVFHRKAHVVSIKEAAVWSAVWVALAAVFAGIVFWQFGADRGVEFVTGYLIEKSLAVDNIFVFVVIFSLLAIPKELQHRVLFWGILGALVMRSLLIVAGAAALAELHWLMYVFGAFLVLTGGKLLYQTTRGDDVSDPADSKLVRWARRVIPTSPKLDGQRFFTRVDGRRMATPLFLALVLVEITDLIFAVDSIPAIFAVTTDPFIVYTSNIFAILGLRSLYFFLAGIIDRFRYLKVGLSLVLVFVGVKMCLLEVWKIPSWASLIVIVLLLGGSVVWSLRATRATSHRRLE
ncbi:MAG: TerC family protein [Deltaproteobacteria bacterium]|nr:TerC family protein [Deltaproteobacteria bacterium]